MDNERKDIELPKTRLVVSSGELLKKGVKGEIISRHRLVTIDNVTFSSTFDLVTAILCVVAIVCTFIAKFAIPSENWSWLVSIVCGLIAVFCLFAVKKYQITIESKQGQVVYDLLDTIDEGMGFVVSLKDIISNDTSSDNKNV